MSAETDPAMDAYDLAMLAAQLMRRQDSVPVAVKTALELYETSKHELGIIQLGAFVHSPETQAQLEQEEAERLARTKIPYVNGVKIITSQDRRSYALKWIKDFLSQTKYKDRPPEQREPCVEAWQAKHRDQGFVGTEVKKLKEEFEQWRGKGKQGRVKKRASDGRLRENRQKKLKAKGEAAMVELTRPKQEWTKHYAVVTMKGARGKKAHAYQNSADNMRDTPGGQTFDANPGLQGALSEPMCHKLKG